MAYESLAAHDITSQRKVAG